MKNIAFFLSLWLLLPGAAAQRLEHFDVLSFALPTPTDGLWRPGAPRFLTAFNPKGYNNQPAFFGPNELYLTVQQPSDTTQTDIFALNLLLNTSTRVTATTTPEYSPTLMPGGRSFSAVRVEPDGAQRLWAFPTDRSNNGRPIFPELSNVGYHCWLRDTLVALFLVGDISTNHALALVGTGRQQPTRVAFNIGRSLQKMPDGRLAYIQKATEQTWFVKTYDLQKKSSEILVKTLPGSEDFIVLPDGTLLAGSGPKLYQYHPSRQSDWKEVADWSRYGVQKITRLAASPDGKLVAVVQ
ncbi:MAG: hypothetical protein IT260_12740 [Saprospiraceae bacterium]|nr:hypothetical protein [Saprospiraceae bacterium]